MESGRLVSALRDDDVVDHTSLAKNRLICSWRKVFMFLFGKLSQYVGGRLNATQHAPRSSVYCWPLFFLSPMGGERCIQCGA